MGGRDVAVFPLVMANRFRVASSAGTTQPCETATAKDPSGGGVEIQFHIRKRGLNVWPTEFKDGEMGVADQTYGGHGYGHYEHRR